MTVSVPATASFPEDAGTVTVCATLTGRSADSINVTVSATDGKSHDDCGGFSVQLRTLFLKAGLIRLKLFESAISPEHHGIEGKTFIPMLISLSLICTRSLEVM